MINRALCYLNEFILTVTRRFRCWFMYHKAGNQPRSNSNSQSASDYRN